MSKFGQDILPFIKDLPDLPMREIFLLYAHDYFKANLKINLPRELICRDFEYIGYFFDKIDNNGFIKFQKSYLNLLILKFPSMSFDFAEPAAMRESIYLCWDLFEKLGNHLNSLLDRRQNGIPKWRDILIAGGYFSKYTDNVFSTEFRDYFEYFKIVKDIDIFYFNPRSDYFDSTDEYENNLYFKLPENANRFNIIGTKNKNTIEIIEAFDWDSCKYNLIYFFFFQLKFLL